MKYAKIVKRRLEYLVEWHLGGRKDPPFPDLNIKDTSKMGQITGYDDIALKAGFFADLLDSPMGFQDVLDKEFAAPQVNTTFSTLAQRIAGASRKGLQNNDGSYRLARQAEIAATFPVAIGEFVNSRSGNLDPSLVTDDKSLPGLVVQMNEGPEVLVELAIYLHKRYMQHLLSEPEDYQFSETVKEAKWSLLMLTS